MHQPALVEPLRRWDPQYIGGFGLIGRLGAGAMGQVYLGRSAAGRLVAVKTIKAELAEEPDFRTRFGQEVAAARRVSGAFTAAVVAADSEADVPWLATVYVPAPSLSTLVYRCGPMPELAVRWLAAGCAEALESIHAAGLVHRDLKPANVLVAPDGPRVIDFGLARAAERIQLTLTRGGVGTPAYMAPEQARDTRLATSASDVYSLGATMLFAATGHPPYHGETMMDVLVRLATEVPELTGLQPALAEIVRPCLERDPRQRPTAASLVARLSVDLVGLGAVGSAPLPPAAMELIEHYRHAPQSPQLAPELVAPRPAEPAGEATFASQPAVGGSPGRSSAQPAGAGSGAVRARRRKLAQRARLPVLLIVVGAALFGAGWAVGHSVAGSSLGPVLTVPPPVPGQPIAQGRPSMVLNQPTGDSNTTFVLHGQNWPPGQRLTVTLTGISSSPIHPITDAMGTFNYAINQDHEFFAGGLPIGVYTVRVTGPGGLSAEARFAVQRPRRGPGQPPAAAGLAWRPRLS